MRYLALICLFIVVLTVSGCFGQPEKMAGVADAAAPPEALPISPGSGWITEQDRNGDGATLTVARMTPAERERVRSEIARNGVTWVNSKTGYTLYKIEGSEQFQRSAFIVPKILVIGSVDGGRASLRELSDGRIALTVPIALVDGSQRELPYATTRIRIPDGLYLDDSKRLTIKKELGDTFGGDHEISSLGSCPKAIAIKIAGVDNDVTPRAFAGPNGPTGCQPNQPFTVTLVGSREYINQFLSDDVFNGSAEIAAMYEVAGSYVDEIRLYQFKTAPIYEQLKAQLIAKDDKGGEVRKALTQDEADKLLLPIVQVAASKWANREKLFERVKTTAVAQMKTVLFDEQLPTGGAERGSASLVLKSASNFKPLDVPVRVTNESLGRQGEVFYSSSIIKPILNSTNVAIRGEERQDLSLPPGNGVAQNVFTVRNGEEYELQLTSLVIHEYEFSDEQAQPKIEDKGLVCLDKPGEALPACRKYRNECTEYKNFCKKPKAGCVRYGTKVDCNTNLNLSLGGCLTLGIFGGCGVKRECSTVPDLGNCIEYGSIGCEDWGNYCSDTHQICEPGQDEPVCKHQISDLRISRYFSAPAPVNNRIVNAPLGNTDQDVVSGLTFRFRWPDGKTIDCAALALLRDVTGQSIRFRVKNNAYCKPFPDGYTGEPVLAIVNRVSTLRTNIPCGIMNFSTVEGTKYYGCNGYTALALTPDLYVPGTLPNSSGYSTAPLYLTYYPVVDVNGVLISRSGAFTSGGTTEGRLNQLLQLRISGALTQPDANRQKE